LTINSGSGTYKWTGNSVNVTKAGDWKVTAFYSGVPDAKASLTVTGHLPNAISITVAPKTSSIAAGSSQGFTAMASDGYNNWDVTNQVVWSIIESVHGGSWNQATGTYTSAKAGTWTVQATLGSQSDTATLTVNANAQLLDHIVVTPKTSIITAGSQQSYSVEAFDIYSNSLGAVTNSAIFAAPGTTITGSSLSATIVGSYTVTATYNEKTDTATLTIKAAGLDHIQISPASSTIIAGVSQSYTATAYDQYSNSLGTVSATYTASTGATISGNAVSSIKAGSYTVTGTYNGKSATAQLSVNAAGLDYITIDPTSSSIMAGISQAYLAEAFDQYGNSLGDVSTLATFTAIGAAVSGKSVSATIVGSYTVIATYNSKTATATLAVTAASIDHVVISPKSASITAGSSQAYSVTAYDQYDNSLGTVTSSATFSVPGATVSGNSVSAASAGSYTVTVTYNGKSDTATLTATAAPTITIATTYTFTSHSPNMVYQQEKHGLQHSTDKQNSQQVPL
jgi:hypothetical protein